MEVQLFPHIPTFRYIVHGFLHPEDASLTPPVAVMDSEVPTHNGGFVVGANAWSGIVEV